MNWLVVGGGALLVIWLAGRRVAKRDGQPVEPIFGSGESSNGGDGYYGGSGGGDGGLQLSSPALAPIGSDIKAAGAGTGTLMENFVSAIGFKGLEKSDAEVELPARQTMTVGTMDSLPSGGATPRSAQVAAATSSSTSMGSSSLSMSALQSTTNNDRAVSTAVQAQPPRSFSSVSAAISEKNMMPTIAAKAAPEVYRATVDQSSPVSSVSQRAVSMPVQQSFVASIRPRASISARPSLLSNFEVRR
jgi:hypothetical protein